jgi:transcriptional regulator with XRE-family HTH domain
MQKALNFNSSLSRNRRHSPAFDSLFPLANRLISQPKLTRQLGRAARDLDSLSYWVFAHDEPSITESLLSATTESYTPQDDALDMDTKQAFAYRLGLALDAAGYPRLGAGRETALAKATGKSQPGVRKWLLGEALPNMTSGIELAKLLNVRFEWLMTGRGMMNLEPEEAPITDEQRRFMYRIKRLTPEEQSRYFRVADAMGLQDLPDDDAA